MNLKEAIKIHNELYNKEQIKKYAKLSDDFYEKWENLSPVDGDYKKIRNKGMCCDAIINVLQELLKG